MPKIEVVYSVYGYVTESYDLPQEVVEQGKTAMLEYLEQHPELEPLSVRKNVDHEVDFVNVVSNC